MIFDDDNNKQKPKKVGKPKKKDLIIQEQNKKRSEKQIQDDIMKIDYAFKNITPENFYDKFNNLKTEKGKQIFKDESNPTFDLFRKNSIWGRF